MKARIISLLILAWAGSSYGAVFGTDCPTIEQQQAEHNRRLAAGVIVRDAGSQQLQTHYQQLAVFFQQLDKDNQQKAKDQQQIDKDKQQREYDIHLNKREQECVTKHSEGFLISEKDLPPWNPDGKGGFTKDHCERWEVDVNGKFLVDGIPAEECVKLKAKAAWYGEQAYHILKEKHKKGNRSGGSDGTNPGGGGNDWGTLNPHKVK